MNTPALTHKAAVAIATQNPGAVVNYRHKGDLHTASLNHGRVTVVRVAVIVKTVEV